MQVTELITDDLPRHEQIPTWERFTADHMVQLSCHSLSSSLRARQRSVSTPGLQGISIEAEAHTIFRPEEHVNSTPTGLMQISTVEGGEVYFQYAGGVSRLSPGNALIFDTDQPYSITFSSPLTFRSVMVPRDRFTGSSLLPEGSPVVVTVPTQLRRTHDALFDATGTPPSAAELIAALAPPDPMAEHFAAVLSVLHLHHRDSDLDASRVAAEAYLSTRQLSRVLSARQTTLLTELTAIRLDSVADDLADPRLRSFSIAEIFHRNGFRSHNHGHRRFVEKFGRTPGQYRRAHPVVSE